MAILPANNITPMMRQYLELKEQHPDCLLFFRLGDFYELFFEDAITASKELELVLTGRNCGREERAPMCGVPFHSVDSYIDRLIAKGYKVAICEQLTDPAKSKGLVERGITRIVTPGTVTDSSVLDEKTNNFVLSLYKGSSNKLGFSAADVSTGAFSLGEIEDDPQNTRLFEELARIQPTEIIVSDTIAQDEKLQKRLKSAYYVYSYAKWAFDPETARKNLLSHFRLADLSGYGCEDMTEGICAAGALLAYLNETQKNALEHINAISVYRRSQFMVLDEATRRNLELTKPIREGRSVKKSTLLGLLDRTKTAMGGRMLRNWINQPLTDQRAINARLDAVSAFAEDMILRAAIGDALDKVYDLERLCSRLSYGTLNARDALSLKNSLSAIPSIKHDILASGFQALTALAEQLDSMTELHAILEDAIAEDPPAVITEGGIIKTGYNEQIDELRQAATEGKDWLNRLEEAERDATGIKNLRIGFNRVFGYYIEVTKSNYALVPLRYERKQTLANSERFITPELKELEDKILGAQERCVALEYEVFTGLRKLLTEHIDRIKKNAELLAELDCYRALASVAESYGYTRPKLTNSDRLNIIDGRHPVVERAMTGFVPNDTLLDRENRVLIITGPNMAGKSTYMRQVALITLMAHIGSFVPATKAEIPLTDRIFTRVGASDDLSFGQSTFMVEMSETANILNNATSRSLVLLDEIGRGTSTYDGLSIAWAVVEYICDMSKIGAKTLFATHFHELSELEGLLDGVVNYRITAREVGEDIVFLRKIVRGGTDKSYGIQVARLAGIPQTVIARAKEILRKLEAAEINRSMESGEESAPPRKYAAVLSELASIKADELTPFEALGLLYDLSEKAREALNAAKPQ
ncbi:MAG: DNA mismatch repair protein MutS [Christensenellales bacterium]|jgi:DNA mismatch repair protein MutS